VEFRSWHDRFFREPSLSGFALRRAAPTEMPVAEAARDSAETPAWLDTWTPWLIATIALIFVSYDPPLAHLIANFELTSAGVRVW
jgi:hypothetical protein